MALLLIGTCQPAPETAPQVPETHLDGELVVELRGPEAFVDGLADHGILALLRDEEMADLMAEIGPFLVEHFRELERETAGGPIQVRMVMGRDGLPTLELVLGGELAERFPDGLPIGSPDAISLALKLTGPGGDFREDPGVVISAHWGEEELPQVREAAEMLVQFGNRMALEHGQAPFFSAVSYGRTEIWEFRSGEGRHDEEFFLAFDDGSIVFSNERQRLISVVENTRVDIPAALARARSASRPGTLVAFLDIESVIQGALAEAGDRDRREAWTHMEALGMDSWSWASLTVRPEHHGFTVNAHLEADGTRGILGALRTSMPAGELLSSVPEGAQFAAGVAMDPAQLYSGLRNMVHTLEPRAAEGEAHFHEEARRALGIEFEDLIGMLGDRVVFSGRMPDTSMPSPPDLFLEVGLRDRAAGQRLEDWISEKVDSGQWPLERVSIEGGTGFRPAGWMAGNWTYMPVFTVRDGSFRASSSRHALNRWLGGVNHPSGMQDVLASLSHGSLQPVTAVMAVDLPDLSAYGWRIGRPFLTGWLSAEETPISPDSLPSAAIFHRNLPPFVRTIKIGDRGVDLEAHGLF